MTEVCINPVPEGIPNDDDLLLKTFVKAAHQGQQGLSELYADAYRDRFIFDHVGGIWYEYTGHSWQPIYTGEQIQGLTLIQEEYLQKALFTIKKNQKRMRDERGAKDKGDISTNEEETYKKNIKSLDGDEKALSGAIRNLTNINYRKAVCEFVVNCENGLSIVTERFDTDPWLMACQNGVVNLRTGTIRDGMPEDYIRRASPTAYRPDASCPMFEQFLLEVLDGDKDTAVFLQHALGMALIGDSDLKQVLIILSGRGRNGKGSLLDTISSVLGPQLCTKITSETLLSSKYGRGSGSATPDIIGLQGLRLAYASETNEGTSFDSAKVKELSGGGTLRGRGVYAKHEVTFKCSHMLILDTNTKPYADAGDYAFWARVKCVDFSTSFVDEPTAEYEKQNDPHLKARLTTEKEGILTWLVKGCLGFQESGLCESASVKAAALQYKDSVDLVGLFITEKCNTTPTAGDTTSKDLFGGYRYWCAETGLNPVSVQKFGRYLTERFESRHSQYGKAYRGVELR